MAMKEKYIMIVDDSDEIRKRLKSLLEGESYQVLDFSDSGQAAEYLKTNENPVSLFILDYHMPVMNGLELCDKIRKTDQYKGTPIFMLTSERNPALMKKGKQEYKAEWLVKPLNPGLMIKFISKIIA